ncbi:DUF3991 domain-containing protein [Ruminococcus sp.]|uniref:DUF3991 domain-containing protein n=1 Tax=Ruminococcus sp. TaxID=41978 RepID=UPI0039A29CEF
MKKQLCIDLEVINYCVKNELLYEDKRGNCVFVGKNDNGQPKYAMLRRNIYSRKWTAIQGQSKRLKQNVRFSHGRHLRNTSLCI